MSKSLSVRAVFGATLGLFLLGSFFPQLRIWGLAIWAFYPLYIKMMFIGAGLLVMLFTRIPKDISKESSSSGTRGYWITAAGITLVLGALFVILRAKTHFLGDGYTALGLLASDEPLVKNRELGEAIAHVWVKALTGLEGKEGALLSFQIISISSGILFAIATCWFAFKQFAADKDRLLFSAGVLSSGYMLLFFGYVENYSLFVFSVALFTFIGMLVATNRIRRWWILPFPALAIFFHILGVTLIPAALYLVLSGTRMGNTVRRWKWKTKLLLAVMGITVGIIVFYHYYTHDYFFRFALVPLLPDRFTVDGYTLISLSHILDLISLLFLLLPGFGLLIVVLTFLPLQKLFKQRQYLFLLILLASSFGAAFLFDPKLGMPRDWDLFAFAGVPLSVFCYYLILHHRSAIRISTYIALLSILLGVVSLSARVTGMNLPEIAVAQFRNHLQLDKTKSMNSWRVLVDYYEDQFELLQADQVRQEWINDFPERLIFFTAKDLADKGECLKAIPKYHEVINAIPVFGDAWANLGWCYRQTGQIDSAIYATKVAIGLNPYVPASYNNLGVCYILWNSYTYAEKALLRAYALDSLQYSVSHNLATLYRKSQNQEKYFHFLSKAASFKDAPMSIIRELGDYYVSTGQYEEASVVYREAVQKGLDTTYIINLQKKFPALKR